jgi:hypothetical protein
MNDDKVRGGREECGEEEEREEGNGEEAERRRKIEVFFVLVKYNEDDRLVVG